MNRRDPCIQMPVPNGRRATDPPQGVAPGHPVVPTLSAPSTGEWTGRAAPAWAATLPRCDRAEVPRDDGLAAPRTRIGDDTAGLDALEREAAVAVWTRRWDARSRLRRLFPVAVHVRASVTARRR